MNKILLANMIKSLICIFVDIKGTFKHPGMPNKSKVNYTKAMFSLDDSPAFEGYHDPDYKWNGYEAPFFTKQIAAKIADYLNKRGPTCQWFGDILVYFDQENESDPEAIRPEEIIYNGKSINVYGIGYNFWVWTIADSSNKPVFKVK